VENIVKGRDIIFVFDSMHEQQFIEQKQLFEREDIMFNE
jgi:ABC-type tungstate transport system permease subunit